MFVEYRIDNDRDDRREVRLARDLNEHDHEATSLENRTISPIELAFQLSQYSISYQLNHWFILKKAKL